LASGINNSALTFTVTPSGTGYPTGGTGKFVMCMDGGTASEEKLLCTARSSTVFTVDPAGRGYDNTSATSHNTGAAVTHVMAAAEIDDASRHINATSDDHPQYVLANGTRTISGAQTFGSDISVGGNAVITGTAEITGALDVDSSVDVAGAAVLNSTLAVTGATTMASTLAVTGDTTVTGKTTTELVAVTGTWPGVGGPARFLGGQNGAAPTGGVFTAGDVASEMGTVPGVWVRSATPAWILVAGGTDLAWTNVTGGVGFANSWVDFGAPEFLVGFRLINGRVYLRGCMKSGGSGATAFTLPSGYQPTARCGFPAVANGAFASVAISSTGVVTATGSNTSFFLDGISFDTLT
jgi:hypothetical protein